MILLLLTPSDIETNTAIDVNDADDIPSNFTYVNGFEKNIWIC